MEKVKHSDGFTWLLSGYVFIFFLVVERLPTVLVMVFKSVILITFYFDL